MMRYLSFLLLLTIIACDAVGNFIDSVDYQAPVINNLEPEFKNVVSGDTIRIVVDAENPESGSLSYTWSAPDSGQFLQPADLDTVYWVAPLSGGTYNISVSVQNEKKSSEASTKINVQSQSRPVVNISRPKEGSYFVQTDSLTVVAHASHDNGLSTIRFYIDGELKIEKDYTPSNNYSFKIQIDTGSVGKVYLKVWTSAFGQPTNVGACSIFLYVEGIPPGLKD